MNSVILELTEFRILRANINVETRTGRGRLQIEPVAVCIRASNSVVSKNVVRMSNPEGTRSLISI
jgi:hypothetical protein